MSTSAKTGLTWSLAILLALTSIATSVSYVVSAHLAQAQAEDTSPGLRQIALITGPNIPPRSLWAFDISYVDDQSQVYYLADASNASVDLIDTRSDRLIGQIGGFRGFHGSRQTQGPGGVLVDDFGQLWASDGDSTVKVIDLSSRTIAIWSDDETTSTLVQRGEGWLLQNIQHTSGIYSFFAALAQTARQAPERALCWWETGAVCERRYRVGEHWHNLRPDALAEYRVGHRSLRFWLEWDRGTMNVRDLTVKFASYEHYMASREWAREGARPPSLLCVAPELAQERRMQRAAQAILTHVSGLVICTTTSVLLREQGPLAPIWSTGLPLPASTAHPAPRRRSVFETISPET